MESTAMLRRAAIRPFVSAAGDHGLARAACLLQHLGLAAVVRRKNTHTTPVLFIVKRHLVQDVPHFTLLVNILQELSFVSYRRVQFRESG